MIIGKSKETCFFNLSAKIDKSVEKSIIMAEKEGIKMEILDKIAMFEKQILAETEFIKTPNSYIFDMTDIEVEGEFTEYFKAIIYRNAEIILEKITKYKQRMKELSELKPIQVPKSESNENTLSNDSEVTEVEPRSDRRDISKYISTLEHSLFEDETKMIISALPKEEKIRLKLYFLKRMLELKKEIRVSVMLDPTKDIGDSQNDRTRIVISKKRIRTKKDRK